MALSNKPGRSLYQIGDTVYFLNGKKIGEGVVTKVVTAVSNPLNDSTGIQENYYYVDGLDQIFTESELFHSKNALLFELKGDYLGKFPFLMLESGNNDLEAGDFSFLNFSGSQFSGCNFSKTKFISSNFSNVNFLGSNLSESVFTFAKLNNAFFLNSNVTDTDFSEANIYGASFVGANLTGSTLPANANTKSTFKSMVGAGNWDPVTTIWTDGLPIGN